MSCVLVVVYSVWFDHFGYKAWAVFIAFESGLCTAALLQNHVVLHEMCSAFAPCNANACETSTFIDTAAQYGNIGRIYNTYARRSKFLVCRIKLSVVCVIFILIFADDGTPTGRHQARNMCNGFGYYRSNEVSNHVNDCQCGCLRLFVLVFITFHLCSLGTKFLTMRRESDSRRLHPLTTSIIDICAIATLTTCLAHSLLSDL